MIVLRTTAAFCGLNRLKPMLALLACLVSAPAFAQQGGTDLSQYYRQMEQQLLAQGHLRQDRWTEDLDSQMLARNFMSIAMRTEYSSTGTAGGGYSPLRRWEQPVRLHVLFGPSVTSQQQHRDLSTVRDVAQRLERATGHPIRMTASRPNFHVLVLNERERRNIRNTLLRIAPGLSRAAQSAVMRMRPNTFCMVIAIPGQRPEDGLQQAIAIVRAEHPPRMRQSCIEEELAQGMGLSNDSPHAQPSIFNDNEEFGVLTRHDELLLRMLYSNSLECGMSPRDALQTVELLARRVLRNG